MQKWMRCSLVVETESALWSRIFSLLHFRATIAPGTLLAPVLKGLCMSEPYPKSMAAKLHKDAVILGERTKKGDRRVPLRHSSELGRRSDFSIYSQ